MRRRNLNAQFTIDVQPFLSILAFIPLVVAFVYIVATVRICISCAPDPRLIRLRGENTHHGRVQFISSKKPTVFVCGPDGVTIQPGNTIVSWDELQRQDNVVVGLLDKIETNSSKECVLLLAQPESIRCFRLMRRILGEHNIEVSEDVVDEDFYVPRNFEVIQEKITTRRAPRT